MLKVCILAAGKGSRNTSAEFSNKALLPVFNRAAISLIMNNFPDDTEFVIAVGHNYEMVQDYLEISEYKRNIKICKVNNFENLGSGPGLSLLSCKEFLQSPFIFTACDTLIKEKIFNISENWVGTSNVNNPEDYLIFSHHNNLVQEFFDKTKIKDLPLKLKKPYKAFIGMAGIYDYKKFWSTLAGDKTLINNEAQVSNGLNGIIQNKIYLKSLSWNDIGTETLYKDLLKTKDVKVLPKALENIYFEKNHVIKFFVDAKKVQQRLKRANFIGDSIPQSLITKNNFLRYDYVDGTLLSDQNKDIVFKNFLKFSEKTIWTNVELNDENKKKFAIECEYFYKNKTFKRVSEFFSNTKSSDGDLNINGINVPPILEVLNNLNWTNLFKKATPVKFHGDPQPENIIVNNETNFVFLDWRESFGKNLLFGDIYYDFGKIYHALIVSGKVIRDQNFNFSQKNNNVILEFLLRENLIRFLRLFEIFLKQNDYDINHVRLMSALIFLNIASLHHNPYDRFIFNYGRLTLHKVLSNEWNL